MAASSAGVLDGDGIGATGPQPGFLDKERIIAGPGFNRWLVPPAALAIHLCIGMAYGFSVFWLPLSKALGVTTSIACPSDVGFFQQLFTTACDWPISTLGWMYTLYFVCLGLASALCMFIGIVRLCRRSRSRAPEYVRKTGRQSAASRKAGP